MRTKYTICLTKEEKKYVRAILNSNHTTPTFKKRANILLMSDCGIGKPESQKIIAARCGVSDVTVYQTIKDFCRIFYETIRKNVWYVRVYDVFQIHMYGY